MTHVAAEILLNNLIGQLVNVDIVMALERLDFVQAATFLDHGAQLLHLRSGHFQHVVDAVQDHLKATKVADNDEQEWSARAPT